MDMYLEWRIEQSENSGIDKDALIFEHYKNDPENDNSLRIDLVKSSMVDDAGNLWVGTASGLDKASLNPNRFPAIPYNAINKKGLSNPIIKSVLVDSYGNLWVGTRKGLNFLPKEKFEKKEFEFQVFYHQDENSSSISHDNIFGILEDSQGYLWIGTYNGLNYLNIKKLEKNRNTSGITDSFNRLYKSDGLPHNFIYSIKEIKPGEYWVATYGQLSRMIFDPKNKIPPLFQNYDMDASREDALVNATTYITEEDNFGNYWIGTFNGLSKFIDDGIKEYFENYKNEIGDPGSLSNNSVGDIHKDAAGRLWIATRSGLNYLEQDKGGQFVGFKNFGVVDGFINDVIQTIEEDDNGNLWLGTNRGLVLFDPDAALSGGQAVLKNYTVNDGTISSFFVGRASYKDGNGTLYFGTPSGLNYFTPSQLAENLHIPTVRITGLMVLNKHILPANKKKAILKKSIVQTEKITLNHTQNILTLEFNALDFTQPEKTITPIKCRVLTITGIFVEMKILLPIPTSLPGLISF